MYIPRLFSVGITTYDVCLVSGVSSDMDPWVGAKTQKHPKIRDPHFAQMHSHIHIHETLGSQFKFATPKVKGP